MTKIFKRINNDCEEAMLEMINDEMDSSRSHLKSLAIQAELVEINYIVQSRKNTPIDSYIELDAMLARVNRRRKK